jgi:copper transport protein
MSMIAAVTTAAASTRGAAGSGRIRPRAALAAVALAGVWILAGPASAAYAHAALVGTTPVRGSVVSTVPAQVVLTFSESVRPVPGKVKVIAPDGSRADTGDPRVSGSELFIPLRPDGARGTYLVSYRVISADSHPIGGAYTYSVGAPSPGGPPALTEAVDTASPVVEAAFPVVRWVGYAGLLLMVGATVVLGMFWPQRLDRAGPGRVIWLGAGLVAASTLAELVLQVPYVAGGGLLSGRGSDVREVLSSQFGAAHLIRLGVVAATLILVRPMVRGQGSGGDRVLLGLLGVIGVATWSVSGHPSASSVPTITTVSDMVHIAAMSLWVGGLVMLIRFVLPHATGPELRAIIPIWSRWATYAVVALVATGLVQAVVEVRTLTALVSTTYGWLLVAKVGVVAAILAVASLTRRFALPGGFAAEGAAQRLRLLVIAEAVGLAAVLGLTSVLVQTTPARTAQASTSLPTVQSALMRDKLFTLIVDVQPAQVGINEIHLYATTPDGLPADVKQWTVKASLPAAGIEPIMADVLAITPDHATGQIGLTQAGLWRFTFTLRTSEIDQSTVAGDFSVAP